MEDNKEINFFNLGIRRTEDIYCDLNKLAEKIEEEYGKDARLEYECGVSVAMGERAMGNMEKIMVEKDIIHTRNEQMPNYRNNSYFGTEGISKQINEDGKYNEPGNVHHNK